MSHGWHTEQTPLEGRILRLDYVQSLAERLAVSANPSDVRWHCWSRMGTPTPVQGKQGAPSLPFCYLHELYARFVSNVGPCHGSFYFDLFSDVGYVDLHARVTYPATTGSVGLF